MLTHICSLPPPAPRTAVVRTDGPPFVDLKAKQGMGFENDFDKVQKHLGPGKVRAAPVSAPGAGQLG